MAQIYEVKEKDTLSAIARKFGVPIAQITGYRSGNPDLIYPGEKLTIGEAPTKLGGLGGTLEAGGGVAPTGQKELPSMPADNLSVFGDLMKRVTERYGREATASGMAVTGLEPSKVSGSTLAGIVDIVKGQKTTGIASIYKSSAEIVANMAARQEREQGMARDNLQLLLDTPGAILKLDDDSLEKAAIAGSVSVDVLTAIRDAEVVNEKLRIASATPTSTPTSAMKEYEWAGGLEGTGMTRAQWLLGEDPEDTGIPINDIAKIDRSSEATKLIGLRGLRDAMTNYRELVDTYGHVATGAKARILEAAFEKVKLRIKDAEGLGAILGADVAILEALVRPSFGVLNYPAFEMGGGKEGVIAGLDETLKTIIKEGDLNFSRLKLKFPQYSNAPYVQALGEKITSEVEQYKSQLQFGEVLVRKLDTGEIGAIPLIEYDPQVYQIIQ